MHGCYVSIMLSTSYEILIGYKTAPGKICSIRYRAFRKCSRSFQLPLSSPSDRPISNRISIVAQPIDIVPNLDGQASSCPGSLRAFQRQQIRQFIGIVFSCNNAPE